MFDRNRRRFALMGRAIDGCIRCLRILCCVVLGLGNVDTCVFQFFGG